MYILSRTLFILYAKSALVHVLVMCQINVRDCSTFMGGGGGCEHVEGDIYFWHSKFIKGPDFLGVLDNFFQ